MAGAAGLALCQGMRWSLPSGSTHQLQRELKNAVCLGFFAWLITRDSAAKILCHGRCGGAQKVLLSWAEEQIAGCFPALRKLVLLLPSSCVQSHQLRKRNEESSPREYPCLISLIPEGLPFLLVAQSLLSPPLYLPRDTPSGKTVKHSPEGVDHNTAYSLHQLGSG